jgi:catechol 2,3-dioxygenase-like lactoylglutathione lyase family enzyme
MNLQNVDLRKTITQLGPVAQLAFVPRDFEACLDYWTRVMGAGPFYLMEHIKADRTLYRGKETHIDFTAAVGYWGDMQIEIVRQHCDTPSIYSNWLAEGREGLHHVLIAVDDMESALQRCQEAGAELLQQAVFRGGSAEVAYLDTGGGPGTMLELWKGDDAGRAFFASVRAAAENWDGRDPVRRLS